MSATIRLLDGRAVFNIDGEEFEATAPWTEEGIEYMPDVPKSLAMDNLPEYQRKVLATMNSDHRCPWIGVLKAGKFLMHGKVEIEAVETPVFVVYAQDDGTGPQVHDYYIEPGEVFRLPICPTTLVTARLLTS